MIVKVAGIISAEGTEIELGTYTAVILDVLSQVNQSREKDTAKAAAERIADLMNLSFSELIRKEQDKEDGK